MNSIRKVFEEKENVNIGYIVAGYPSLDFTKEFLVRLSETNLDLLEIGIPYSDPLADGKLISEASFTASQAGVTTDTVFDLLFSVKEKCSKPLIFLVYYNLIFAYGIDKFIPDLPYEESKEISEKLKAHHIAFIPLLSVTSEERISQITSLGDGFVYAIGSLGVTGSQQVDLDRLESFVSQIRSKSQLPISLGFGIKTNEDVKKMRKYADGVIIGTSIVSLTTSGDIETTIEQINNLFKE